MLSNVFKNSIAAGLLITSSALYAATFSISEELGGEFFADALAGSITYNLTSADGSLPNVNTVTNLASQTGEFTRDAGGGNTFFGTLSYIINEVKFLDSETFSTEVKYSGDLLITGGTGIFDGATGTGTFTGTDLYFAILSIDPELSFKAASVFAAAISPSGITLQNASWSVSTGDVNAVPVPAAAWLFGSGILGWAGARRKSKTTIV